MYYKLMIPKSEIADREVLWNKAKDLVTKLAPTNQSGWYWAHRGDEIVYRFENGDVAVLFAMYCTNECIRFRPEWPTES